MVLKVDKLSLRFGDLVANDNITLSVPERKIVALIGPNGAGKTTLFDSISGVYKPNEGRVTICEKDITGLKPHIIHKMGISRTYQIINLFEEMTVLENVLIGMHDNLNSNFFQSLLHTKTHSDEEILANNKCIELLELVGLETKANHKAGSLPYGEQRVVEIVRAIASDPVLLLLDEPAAGMNSKEKNDLDLILKKIMQNWDLSILMVEHDMGLVMEISDYIYVLNYGKLIASGTPYEIQNNEQVIEAYLGRDEDVSIARD